MAYKDGSRIKGGKHYRQHTSFKDFVRRRDNYTCQLCGEYGNIVDHIIPYAVKPETTLEGVRTLCRACNLAVRRKRKDARLPIDEWYADLARQLKLLESA